MFTRSKLNVECLEDRCTPSGLQKELTFAIDPPPKAVEVVTTVTVPAQAAIQVVEHNPNAFFAKAEPKPEPKPDQKEIIVSIIPPQPDGSKPSVVTTVSLPAHAAVEVIEHNPNAFGGKIPK
jgi:hypothetical protein